MLVLSTQDSCVTLLEQVYVKYEFVRVKMDTYKVKKYSTYILNGNAPVSEGGSSAADSHTQCYTTLLIVSGEINTADTSTYIRERSEKVNLPLKAVAFDEIIGGEVRRNCYSTLLADDWSTTTVQKSFLFIFILFLTKPFSPSYNVSLLE